MDNPVVLEIRESNGYVKDRNCSKTYTAAGFIVVKV